MWNDLSKVEFWQRKKGNGLCKVQFFQINTKGKEKTHAVFERASHEGIIFLIKTMEKWGNDKKRVQKGWRLYDENLVCLQEVLY